MTAVRVESVRRAEYVELLGEAGVDVVDRASPILLADPQFITAGNVDRTEWVQSTWAGVDAVEWDAVPASVPVTNLPGVFGPQIAEFVFGYLLGRTQRVPERHATRRWDTTLPSLLRGTTIGIMGAGSIGSAVARVARALEMKVVGCRRSGEPAPLFDEMYAVTERVAFAVDLDHLVVVLPATDETRQLVDAEVLTAVRRGATFVNAGRGSTVVTDDVVAAVSSDRLGLAVLDVTEPEPLPEGHPAWSHPNIVITGHTAAHSRPADVVPFFVDNLRRFAAGSPLVGVVDRAKGY